MTQNADTSNAMPQLQRVSNFRNPSRIPLQPCYMRRSKTFDYSKRGTYRIILYKDFAAPLLSNVEEAAIPGESPVVTPTALGFMVDSQLMQTNRYFPEANIVYRLIMPDRLFFILYISRDMRKSLKDIISDLKGRCTKALYRHRPSQSKSRKRRPAFMSGYCERLITTYEEQEAEIKDMREEPRRLSMKRNDPELFGRMNEVRLAGMTLHVYGNIFLLRNPLKDYVKISRKCSAGDLEQLWIRWREIERCGGVLVSPFIGKEEKHVRNEALKCKGKVIQIVDVIPTPDNLDEKQRHICHDGRMLIVAMPWASESRRSLSRETAVKMNEMACWLVENAHLLPLSLYRP